MAAIEYSGKSNLGENEFTAASNSLLEYHTKEKSKQESRTAQRSHEHQDNRWEQAQYLASLSYFYKVKSPKPGYSDLHF